MLLKLIVAFMSLAIEGAALVIIAACGITAYGYANGQDSTTQWVYASFGVLIGVFVTAIILGIPVLLLRMNKNLDDLNSNLLKVRERMDSAGKTETLLPVPSEFSRNAPTEHSAAA